MKRTVVATCREGEKIAVDFSDDACKKFGVKEGSRIRLRDGRIGTVVGVAPAVAGVGGDGKPAPDALWIQIDGDGGASYLMDKSEFKKLRTPKGPKNKP